MISRCLLSLLIMSSAILAAEKVTPAMVVVAVRAEKSEMVTRQIRLTGTLTSLRESRLSSRTDGLVENLLVDAGSVVKKGDPLMVLDAELAQIGLAQVRAEVTQAELKLAEAERLAKEVEGLAQRGGFSKSEAANRQAMAGVSAAHLQWLTLREKEALETVDRHRLLAPFDGVISEKFTEVGEWVATGDPVVRLVQTDDLRFDLQAPQEWVGLLQKNAEVVVHLDAYPAVGLTAKIVTLVPVKDAVSRTFLVRMTLENDEKVILSPGMSGAAEIISREEREVVEIPRDAVVRFPDGTAKVWQIEEGGGEEKKARVKSLEIKTLGLLGEKVEVLEGLSGDELLVLQGNEGLREGQLVEVIDIRKSLGSETK